MAGTRREVGPLLLVRHYIERLGLVGIVDRALPMRGRARLTNGEVVAALVANRLAAPSPLYDVAGWASGAAMAELFSVPGTLLNDDRLGRALEDVARSAEDIRGAAALSAIQHFDVDARQLHVDLTQLRFCGAYERSTLVAKGWGSDRKIKRQVEVLQAVTAGGVPLYVRPHPGSTAELVAIGAALERLRDLLGPGLVVVADSALGHIGSLCAADRAGLRFVVPLRADTGFAERFLSDVGMGGLRTLRIAHQAHLPPERRTVYKGALRSFDVTDPQTGESHSFHVAYIWSSEEAKSVCDARRRALDKATEALGRICRGLGGRYYKTKADVDKKVATICQGQVSPLISVRTGERDGRPTLSWSRNEPTIRAAGVTDGVYALATNLAGPMTAASLLKIYKNQIIVERRHRDAKSTLRVRPVFLHNDDRIEGLVAIVGLALLVFGLIEADLRRAIGGDGRLEGLLPEGRAARPTGRNILGTFQGLDLTYTPNGIVIDRLTVTQRRILELLGVNIPWPEPADA
jgi:transposase